jgi:hypothetical protein
VLGCDKWWLERRELLDWSCRVAALLFGVASVQICCAGRLHVKLDAVFCCVSRR